MVKSKELLHLAFVFVFLGCSDISFKNESEVWEYVRDPANGLIHKREINDFSLSIYYKPKALLISQELQQGYLKQKKLEYLKEKYTPYDYFIVQLRRNNADPLYDKNNQQFSDLLRKISYQFSDYIYIKNGSNQKVLPVDFAYTPMFGLSDRLEIMVIFDNDLYQSLDQFKIHIKEIGFGLGDQTFEFNTAKIKNIPEFSWNLNQPKN